MHVITIPTSTGVVLTILIVNPIDLINKGKIRIVNITTRTYLAMVLKSQLASLLMGTCRRWNLPNFRAMGSLNFFILRWELRIDFAYEGWKSPLN
jgi:hypothetical protein